MPYCRGRYYSPGPTGHWRDSFLQSPANSMLTKLLKAKIHRAVVTFTDVDYHGSITIDAALLEKSGLLPNEAVVIADCDNGNRFETYIIPGKPSSGMIGINGAAAHLTAVGHRVIIMSYVLANAEEIAAHRARVVLVDAKNHVTDVLEQPTIKPIAKASLRGC